MTATTGSKKEPNTNQCDANVRYYDVAITQQTNATGASGATVYFFCIGYTHTRALINADGRRWPVAAIIPVEETPPPSNNWLISY